MKRRLFCKILLVVVAVFSLLALSGVLFAQGRSEDALARAMEVQEKHTARLMAMDGVEGTAVGLGQGTRPVVTVFTENEGVPGIPNRLDGVPVKVVVTGKIYALPKPPGTPGKGPGGGDEDPPADEPVVDRTGWCSRPVPIGVSTGHPDITAGTIGCRVTDGTNVYALSNNHVYANENLAIIGDNVLQPGPSDGGGKDESRDDVIGTLSEYEEILFYNPLVPPDTIPPNTIDAAIAGIIIDNVDEVDTPRVGNATPDDGYGRPKSSTVDAKLNQIVKKYGRTTGLTKGQVWALNVIVDVCYDYPACTKVARFVGQIGIVPTGGVFSDGGDSGSLIVTQKGNPVGLLFAGGGGWTFANPIDAVLDRFGVSIDGK